MSKTKTTICLILLASVIISVISPVFLGMNKSYAAPGDIPNTGNPDIAPKTSPPPQKSEETLKSEVDKFFISQTSQAVESPCGWWPFSGTCLNYYTAWFMFNIVFRVTNWLTWAGGMVFNAAIFFSLSGQAFDTTENSLIFTGWKATRDFANLFFIFIILYIAIATILQLSGYGSKSLLIKVIIVALLINFSLMITKVVIDASHVLAWEFYNKIDVSGGGQYQIVDKDESGIKIKKDTGLTGEENGKKDLSAVFMAGFNVQKMVGGQAKHDQQREILQSGRGVVGAFWDIILIYFLGSIVNLIAAFILFAGGILFIIRVVVLWFVMILAPLAFVGMILPGKMAGFAKTWWDKLFSQAFFAPAFLFLFYLVTVMINSKFLQNMIISANSAGDAWYGDTLVVIFHFIIIGGLTIGCLIIAQQMGAHGAGMMINWGKKLQGAAQGYAGYYSRRGAGLAAEGLLRAQKEKEEDEKEGWIKTVGRGAARVVGRIPMANRGLGKASSWRERQMKEETKKAGKEFGAYSKAGLGAIEKGIDNKILGRNIVFPQTRKGFDETMKKKEIERRKKDEYEKIIKMIPEDEKRIKEIEGDATGMGGLFEKNYKEMTKIKDGIEELKKNMKDARRTNQPPERIKEVEDKIDDSNKKMYQNLVERKKFEQEIRNMNDRKKKKEQYEEKKFGKEDKDEGKKNEGKS